MFVMWNVKQQNNLEKHMRKMTSIYKEKQTNKHNL